MDSPEYLSFHFYWDELFATGIFPLAIIVFLNTRIYFKVKWYTKIESSFYIKVYLRFVLTMKTNGINYYEPLLFRFEPQQNGNAIVLLAQGLKKIV